MAENSTIEWLSRINPDGSITKGHTASPWYGCSHVHAGCDNCYAEMMAKRNPRTLGVWGDEGTRVKSMSFIANLHKWNRAAEATGTVQSVFPSMCDPFEDRPELEPWRREMFEAIDQCPWLRLILLTKRPQNVPRMWLPCAGYPDDIARGGDGQTFSMHRSNVWLLTSVSDQATADVMVPQLRECIDLVPVLGLSAEPLLGPVDLLDVRPYGRHGDPKTTVRTRTFDFVRWVIIGCESGHGRRPMQQQWAERIVEQCRRAGVAVFMKQMAVDGAVTGELERFPKQLQVREYPESAVTA